MASDSAIFYAEFDPYSPEAISIKARVDIAGFRKTVEVASLPVDFFSPGNDAPYEPGNPLMIRDLEHILYKHGWRHGGAAWYDDEKNAALASDDKVSEGNASVRVEPSHWSGPLTIPNDFLAELFGILNRIEPDANPE